MNGPAWVFLETAREGRPGPAEAHLVQGEKHLLAGQHAEARASFARARAIRPASPAVRINIGIVSWCENDLDQAADALLAALDLKGDHPLAQAGVGLLHLAKGEFASAADLLGRSSAARPDQPKALANEGIALAALGQFDDAIGTLTLAAESAPDSREIRENLAAVLAAAGRPEEAEAARRLADPLAPHVSPLTIELAVIPPPPETETDFDTPIAVAVEAEPDPAPSQIAEPAPEPEPTPAPEPTAEVSDEVRSAVLKMFGAEALATLDEDDTNFLPPIERPLPAPKPIEPPPAPEPAAEDGFTLADPATANPGVPPSLEVLVAQIERESHQAADAPTSPEATNPRAGSTSKHIVFSLASLEFAVPMANVLEIQRPPRVTPLPNVPDWLLGVTNLRGDIISVVDLRSFFGMDAIDYDASGRVMVVRGADGELITGLIVDRVAGITALESERLGRPATLREDAISPYVRGVVPQPGGRLLVALDLDELLLSPEMRQFQPT